MAYLATHAPPGRLAATRGAEAVLARVCVVLTDWETAYRTGQLPAHAIIAPLAAAELPVWVASNFDGDLVLVPAGRLDEAIDVLRHAGHDIAG